MALLDFLKRKKEIEKSKPFDKAQGKPVQKKAEDVLVAKKTEEQKSTKIKQQSIKDGKFSYEVVKEPHISEKANYLAEENKYVFKVYNRANKPEIKKSVEGIYRVDVLDVKVITIPHKKRRLGKTQGFRKGYRKAIVTIKEGQKIEIF